MDTGHVGAGGVQHPASPGLQRPVNAVRLPVGTDEHPSAGEGIELLVPHRAESQRLQPLHFEAVVHDIAQASHPTAGRKRPFRLRDGVDHPEAETRSGIYFDIYLFLFHHTRSIVPAGTGAAGLPYALPSRSARIGSIHSICCARVMPLLSSTTASAAFRSGLTSRS